MSSAANAAGRRASAALAAVLFAAFLAFYLSLSFGLSGDANVLRLNSSIFDMDVGRIVHDWATPEPGRRTHVHPLYKLLLAPLGTGLRTLGLDALGATRLLVGAAMALHAVLAGVLARQLTGGARGAGALAALLCAVSFSSLLLGSIPDAASVSCLATLAPLILLGARAGRPFTWGESAGWALLGVFGLAVTLTQIAHWAIALLARATWMRPRPAAAGRRGAAKAVALLAGFLLLTAGAALLQDHVYPGTGRFWERKSPLRELRSFQRLERLDGRTLPHALRLADHFAGVNFVAPFPGHSDYVIREWKQPYWSLSLELSASRRFTPAQRMLYAVWLGLLLPAALLRARPDRRFAAPLLAITSQFALHLVYGREYILYSPNWQGAVTAVLVAAAWNGWPRHRRALALATVALSLALALNGVIVMKRVYREVEAGLQASVRDESGRPLHPLP